MIQDGTKESEAKGMRDTPLVLYLLCLAGLVLAVLTALAVPSYVHDLKELPILWLTLLLLTFSGLKVSASLIGVYGLFRRRNWGWWVLMVLLVVDLGMVLADGTFLVLLASSPTIVRAGLAKPAIPLASSLLRKVPWVLFFIVILLGLLTRPLRAFLVPRLDLTKKRITGLVCGFLAAFLVPVVLMSMTVLSMRKVIKDGARSRRETPCTSGKECIVYLDGPRNLAL